MSLEPTFSSQSADKFGCFVEKKLRTDHFHIFNMELRLRILSQIWKNVVNKYF